MKSVILCLVCSLSVITASGLEQLRKFKEAPNGRLLMSIANYTDEWVYCVIENKYYFKEFNVGPYKQSRWYYEPEDDYEWGCE